MKNKKKFPLAKNGAPSLTFLEGAEYIHREQILKHKLQSKY